MNNIKLYNIITEEYLLLENRDKVLATLKKIGVRNSDLINSLLLISEKYAIIFFKLYVNQLRLKTFIKDNKITTFKEAYPTKKALIDYVNEHFIPMDLESKLVAIRDYFQHVDPNNRPASIKDLNNLTINDVYQVADEWHKSLESRKMKGGEVAVPPEEIMKEYPDKWYWVNLHTHNCERSKELMGHCATTDSDSTLYALRHLDNNYDLSEHITIAVDDSTNIVKQIKGVKNSKPKPEYHPYIVDFLTNVYQTGPEQVNITGFGSEYKSEDDFHPSDLSRQLLVKFYTDNNSPLMNTLDCILLLINQNIITITEAKKHLTEEYADIDDTYFNMVQYYYDIQYDIFLNRNIIHGNNPKAVKFLKLLDKIADNSY